MKNKIIGCFISFLLIGIIFSYNITDIFADNVSVIKYYKCNNGGTLSGNKCIKDISISTYCKKGERHYGSCYDVIRKEYEKTTPTYTCPEGKLIKNSTEPGNIDGYICEYEKEKLTKCPDGYGQTSATTCIRTYQYNATYNGVDCGDSENIPYTNLCKKEVNATPNYTCKTSYFKKKDNYTCMNAYNVKVNSDYICPSNTTQVGSSASCIKTVASYNAKKVGKKYKCNSNGYKLKGSKCIKTKVIRGTLKETYSCPHGGERQGNVCVQTESTIVNYTCNNGKLKGNKCILTSKGRTKWKCTRSDSVLVGDKCNVTVTKDLLPTCKDGFKAKAGDSSKCVRYFSPKKIVQETTNTSNKTTFSKKIEIPCPSDYTPVNNAEQTPTISNGNKTEPDKIEQTENSVIKRYIVVDKNYNTLNVGDKKKISAKYYVVKTVNNKSNTTLNNENLEYLSSNENILSVDARGVITALSEGEATITVRAKDNNDIVETVTYKVLPSSNVINLVKLEETVYDIAKGDSKYIKIIDDNVENYTFISANKKVATVDDLGEIKGISRGNTTIDIINKNNNNIRSNILVNVSETNSFNSFEDKNNIISIDLNIKRVNIVKGKTFNLNANATDGSKLKYKSSNSRVATVSSDGKIKGTSKGNAIITISLENNPSIKEDVVVNVVNKEKELNDFEKYNAEKLGLKTNSITIEEEDNYVIKTKDIKDIKYYSTNQNVASVSSDGVITAQKQGTCKVYITSSDTSDYITVKVNKKTVPEKVIIAQKSLDLTVGKTEKLDVEVLPKNAKNKDVIYSSTNSNIVSISDDGVVTAMQVGTAYVQAMSLEDNAVKAYIKVTVK